MTLKYINEDGMLVIKDVKNVCPVCNGNGYKIYKEEFGYCWEEDYEIKETQYQCDDCKGTGKISDLAMAIYKARGDYSPLPIKDFA